MNKNIKFSQEEASKIFNILIHYNSSYFHIRLDYIFIVVNNAPHFPLLNGMPFLKMDLLIVEPLSLYQDTWMLIAQSLSFLLYQIHYICPYICHHYKLVDKALRGFQSIKGVKRHTILSLYRL